MTFAEALSRFQTGNPDGILHPEAGLRLPDKVLIRGETAVAEYFRAHPELFSGLVPISPDSEVTVTFKNNGGALIKIFAYEGKIGKIVEFRPDDIRQRLKLTIEYDGTDFSGFQIQPEGRTVQDELQKAVSLINGAPTAVTGASRTDAGVHALGQVVHFDTNHPFTEDKWVQILRHALPPDIGVVSLEYTHPLFHARYDVEWKEYRYILHFGSPSAFLRNREWTVDPSLNRSRLAQEMQKIVGTHDFSAFCKGANPDGVRTIFQAETADFGDRLHLRFVGDGFLHNMIRLLVGSMVEIASGRSEIDITALLSDRSRRHTRFLAPAGGLYLVSVHY